MAESPPDSDARSHGRKTLRPSLKPRDLMDPGAELARAWRAQVITLFPEAFPGTLGLSLTGRALKDGRWQLQTVPLRAFGIGKHKNVDDTPTGGGPGMVLRADVMAAAVETARATQAPAAPLIYLSPRGRPFTQDMARDLAARPGVTLVCGRFEGLDQRVIDHFGMAEVSLGDFVMTGGEIAAQALLDSCVRLLPGVLGNAESAAEESFAAGLLEHPQYTRPTVWNEVSVPEVLLSGNHAEIARWRRAEALALTRRRRPDMLPDDQAD
jgi:tRNA (guanine37-N1)-methyltransferase